MTTTLLPERHYPNAPITEAVIDLMVQSEQGLTLDDLDGIRDEAYPSRESVVVNQVQFVANSTTTTRASLGWRFRSSDGTRAYQVRLNGFGASRLAPYENWATFRSEAQRLWLRYRECVRPQTLQRLAVRYINRIDIPLPLNDFGEYLLTAPQVSPHLPQELSHYVMNLTIPFDNEVTAVVTEAVLNPHIVSGQNRQLRLGQDAVSILLDIDVSQINNLPAGDTQVWERLEHLRKIKNHVFESCITDRTRELFL